MQNAEQHALVLGFTDILILNKLFKCHIIINFFSSKLYNFRKIGLAGKQKTER